MRINIKNTYNNILLFFIILLIFSYAGILASYKSCTVYSVILLLFCILGIFLRKIILFRIEMNWLLLIIYMFLTLAINFPKSILYFILFILGIIMLYKRTNDIFFVRLIKFSKIISLILATSIIIQRLFPSIFYEFAKYYYYYSNQYEMVYEAGNIAHKYSGLIYEVSFAAFILSIGFACYFSEVIKRKQKVLFNMISLIYIYYAIILTDKRSFILIIPFVACVVLLLVELKKISIRFIFLVIFVLIICFINFGAIFELVSNILSDGTEISIQLSSREKYWNIIITMFKHSPIIGCGMNSFDEYFNSSNIKNIYLYFAGAHNSYLQMLSELGIIGATLYILSLIRLTIKTIRCLIFYRLNDNQEKLYLVIIATFMLFVCMIYALTGNVFYQPQQLITFFVFGNIVINQYDYMKKIKGRI